MTPEERYQYDVDGYLLIENAIPPALLTQLNQVTSPLYVLAEGDVVDIESCWESIAILGLIGNLGNSECTTHKVFAKT